MKENILIADVDKSLAKELEYSLEQEDYSIDKVYRGRSIFERLNKKNYDLVILELEMPDINGLEICRRVRAYSLVPIFIVSTNNEDINKILAFEYGADDYLVKPFNILELKGRIRTILRRVNHDNKKNTNHIFKIKNFIINSLRRKITIDNKDIRLTSKEFDLFYVLSSNPGKVFTREELLDKVWGYAHHGDVRTVDVHVRRIREKIEKNAKDTQYIMTKWGVGYYFNNI